MADADSQAASDGSIEYLVSGRLPNRGRTVHAIVAASPEAAMAELEGRGYGEVSLHTDDIDRAALIKPLAESRDKAISARSLLRLRYMGPIGIMFWQVGLLYKALRYPLIGCFIGLVVRRFLSYPLGRVDAVLGAALVLPIFLSFLFRNPGKTLRRVEIAIIDGNYEEVIRLIPALREETSVLGEAASIAMATEWHAKALANLGRIDEAVSLMDQLGARDDIPPANLRLRLGHVYAAGKDYEQARECFEESIELDGTEWIAWAELAELLSTRLERPKEARRALDALKNFTLSEDSRMNIDVTEGAIALCEGRFEAAIERLGSVVARVRPWIPASPMAAGVVSKYESLIAIALAKLGRMEEARGRFAAAEPILTATRDEQMLRRCRQALGRHM